MTFLFPSWMQTVIHLGVLFLVILVVSYLVSWIAQLLKFKKNNWIIPTTVIIVGFILLFVIHKSYRSSYVMDHELVVSGAGEIIEVESNDDWLMTTDEALFIFDDSPLEETILYEFQTLDRDILKMELKYTSHDYDVLTLKQMSQRFADEIKGERDENIPLYLSYYSYFFEVWKDAWEEELTAAINKLSKDDLTEEKIKDLLLENEKLVLNDFERNVFSVHLGAWK